MLCVYFVVDVGVLWLECVWYFFGGVDQFGVDEVY